MNGLPYYPRYPRDFFDGTNGMAFELKGAYAMLLDLIYMCGGQLYDEPRFIAGHMNCSVRAWGNYRSALIERGKITVENGIISNFRADKELIIQRSFQDKQRINASHPRKNNGLTVAVAEPKPSHTDTHTEKEEERGKPLLSFPGNDDLKIAVADYNNSAALAGWPQVKALTDKRKAALKGRLRDIGGLAGWSDALARARASPHLCGQNDRGWTASFDFLTTQSSFAKLIEGNYDARPRSHNPEPTPQGGKRPDAALEQIARLTGIGAASGDGRGGTGSAGEENGPLWVGARPQ